MKNVTQVLLIVAIIVIIVNIIMNFSLLYQSGDLLAGQQTGIARVFVLETVSLTLPVSTVDFGSLNNGDIDDTLTAPPDSLQLENNGNVMADITIQAGDDLWDDAAGTSAYFQFQSEENEAGSIDPTGSVVGSWTNIPISPDAAVTFATKLKHQGANDLLNGHVSVEVPADEGSGQKESTITFTASKSA